MVTIISKVTILQEVQQFPTFFKSIVELEMYVSDTMVFIVANINFIKDDLGEKMGLNSLTFS